MPLTQKDRRSLVLSVTLGGILEWYEIFLYSYWASAIGEAFFAPSDSSFVKITNAFLVFAFGFLSRPLGGIIFGRIGDHQGRRTAFIYSIVAISIPSILIGFLPGYATWGAWSVVILGVLRFLQGIPAGGELPGAMCYLAECSPRRHSNFFGSFAFVGPQIGGIVGMLEAWGFETLLSNENLIVGLRASFIVGGSLAVIGVFLRKRLKETPFFHELEVKHMTEKTSLGVVFNENYKKMILMFFVSLLEVVGYFIVAIFPVAYFDKLFNISVGTNLIISIVVLLFSALTIPLFGALADRYNAKSLLFISALGVVGFSYPFYLAVTSGNLFNAILMEVLLVLFLNVQFALLPSLLVRIAPVSNRFTCLGFSFNVCDSLIGGSITYAALSLIRYTNNPGSFVILLVGAAILSIGALFFVQEERKE